MRPASCCSFRFEFGERHMLFSQRCRKKPPTFLDTWAFPFEQFQIMNWLSLWMFFPLNTKSHATTQQSTAIVCFVECKAFVSQCSWGLTIRKRERQRRIEWKIEKKQRQKHTFASIEFSAFNSLFLSMMFKWQWSKKKTHQFSVTRITCKKNTHTIPNYLRSEFCCWPLFFISLTSW